MEYCLDYKGTFETWVMNYPIRQPFVDQLIHVPCLAALLNEIAGCDMFSLNIEIVGENKKIQTEGGDMGEGERTDTARDKEEDMNTVTVDEHEGNFLIKKTSFCPLMIYWIQES